MKTKYILLIILLTGCGLFKKTTKSSTASSFDLSKQTEQNQLDLKTTQKETQIYSYWKDSILYQFEVIREQIDQAKIASEKTQESQHNKQIQTVKVSKPVEAWIYAGIALGIIGFVLIYRKVMP